MSPLQCLQLFAVPFLAIMLSGLALHPVSQRGLSEPDRTDHGACQPVSGPPGLAWPRSLCVAAICMACWSASLKLCSTFLLSAACLGCRKPCRHIWKLH